LKQLKADLTTEIIEILKRTYPKAKCALHHRNPLELLVSTILSAQCTDERVNKVTEKLFQKYRSAKDFSTADPKTFEQEIKPTGFFRNKAKSILGCTAALVEKHGGEVPKTMEELLELPGVGRKTANVILGNAFGIASGIVVDTHVRRLANRIGFSKEDDPEKIEQDLMKIIPKSDWILFANALIWHGRKRCRARNPDCSNCEIAALCPKIGVSISI